MISLFRRIREKLIASGSITKYLLYAIGEILLVVIGILIALQVNNWNEIRKERNTELKLLRTMAQSVAGDTSGINGSLKYFEGIRESADWLRVQLDTRAAYTARMDTAFARISVFTVWEPDYSVFDNLESIGFSLVKDDSLRNAILDYYKGYRFIAGVDDYFAINKFYREEVYPKYFKRYRYGRIAVPANINEIYDSTEFSVVLDYSINDAYFYLGNIQAMKEAALTLLELLEENIES